MMMSGARQLAILAVVVALTAVLISHILERRHQGMASSSLPIVRYVSGYFKHDQQPTGPEKGFRAHTLPSFGILERAYETDLPTDEQTKTQWQRFENFVRKHNEKAPAPEKLKVLFVGRHGEGVHNVKEREVGRHEWDRYWSKLDGDETTTWLDARLTEKGKEQARSLATFWQHALQTDKIPAPEQYYVSPLTRCLETAQLTYSTLTLPHHRPFHPTIKESLREINGEHTCDKRRTKSQIQGDFPSYTIEAEFSEEDELWRPDWRETIEERVPWIREFLEGLFEDGEQGDFVSITTHTGVIRALCLAIGHPDVWVAAGAIVPIVVRRGGGD